MTMSVVIPAYGPSPWLADCLAALGEQSRAPDEIVVQHSGADDPGPRLGARFPNVRFLHSEERLFPGGARNAGAAAARGEALAFLDCDMIAAPGWLAALEAAIAARPGDVAIGSIGRAAHGGVWARVMWFIECGASAPHRRAHDMASAAGANFALTRRLWEEGGGFREDLLTAEDGDLFVRLRGLGARLGFTPAARGDHVFVGGAGSLWRLAQLGRAAASLRRGAQLPGSAAVRRPILALGLPAARLAQMARRLVAEGGPVGQFLLLSPLITLGLCVWAYGFWAEARR